MSLEYDERDVARRRHVPASLRPETRAAMDLMTAARLRGRELNALTGTCSVLEASAPDGGSLVENALASAIAAATAAGDGPPELVPDANVYRTSAGTGVVHLHQHHRGIPVYESVRSVRFDTDGNVREIVGDHAAMAGEIDVLPTLSAADAVMVAARHLAAAGAEATPEGKPLEVSNYSPRVIAEIPLPNRPTWLVKRPFADPVTAHLVLLFCGQGDVRLGWLTTLTTPDEAETYDLIVAANSRHAGKVLYCKGSYHTAQGRATVFLHDPREEPATVDVPLPRSDYPAFDDGGATPPSFGFQWIADDRTRGNNAAAIRGNRKRATLRGSREGNTVVFAPDDPRGEDQQLLNAFYFCNFLHDFFLFLGFGEAEGCFQRQNRDDVPGDRDELDVRVFPGPVNGLARMSTRRDGRPCQLHLGVREEPGEEDRHTALDADLVYHEYVHGVTSRLVGGRRSVEPLRHPESRALGEGYSDYFALTIRSWQKKQEETVFGAWLSGNETRGLRRHAYTDDYPFHYGDLADPENQVPHNGGEIWCAALMRLDRALGRELGDVDRGHVIGWRLVTDSLKLLPVGQDKPGFLDARDALIQALADLAQSGGIGPVEGAAAERAMGAAFAQSGMGPNAQGGGAHFQGIVADFTPFNPGGIS